MTDTEERRLATIETIAELAPIPEADAIERARVRGWDVVVKKGEFQVGDSCVYFEIDSLLDVDDPRFASLAMRGVKTDSEGRTGHVLKTARLRGQYSQGLVLPFSKFPELQIAAFQPGDDVTDMLKIVKWDPPIPDHLIGRLRGTLPGWIPRTSEARIQNFADVLAVGAGMAWWATEKVDGNSCTVYVDPQAGYSGVCMRRWDLIESDGHMWGIARRLKLHERIHDEWPNQQVAIQGELYGEGFRGNPLKVTGTVFAAFNLQVDGKNVLRKDWPTWLLDLAVPVHDELVFPATVEEALAQVDGLKSKINPARAAEGIVWRGANTPMLVTSTGLVERASFKVISNSYLLKHDQ